MQNYILIKKYPGSPELGYVTDFNHNGEDWATPNMLIEADCSDWPEFWISVKEHFGNNVIYAAESGTEYTLTEVIELARGNEEYANDLIQRATWQHIETLIDEDLREGEMEEYNNSYRKIAAE